MLLSKKFSETVDIIWSCTLILGITFIILNTLFPILTNIAFTNWFIGLIIGTFYCVSNISDRIEEYPNDNIPNSYRIWRLLYPLFFLGIILALLYDNFVAAQSSKILNWIFGISLALTFCTEIYFNNKYETLDEYNILGTNKNSNENL